MDRIRELRQAKGLSQAKLAVSANMDPATLNRIEQGKGNPNLKTLQRLAEALDVEVGDLLPKAQSPLPLEDESIRQRVWQSAASIRIELLEYSANLWEEQVERGQYDLETIKKMEGTAFYLAYGHVLEEPEMRRWCPQEQQERLDRAEKSFEEAYERVGQAFEAELEKEKTRLSRKQVADLEEYRAKHRSSLQSIKEANTG